MTPRTLRITTFGTAKSGKTSLARRLLNKAFHATYQPTTVTDAVIATVFDPLHVGKNVKVIIFDTPGLENMRSMGLPYLKDSNIIMFAIDASATSLDDQFTNIREGLKRPCKQTKLNIVLTKMDLLSKAEQKIKKDYVKSFIEVESREHSLTLYTASAKTDLGMKNLVEDSLRWVPPLSADELSSQLYHKQQSILKNVCHHYLKLTKTRVFSSTDSSRKATVQTLHQSLHDAKSPEDLIAALISAVKDIRTPAANNRRKYGVTFFFGFLHYGDYKNSKLYQLIKAELVLLDPKIAGRLDELSKPVKQAQHLGYVYGIR